MKRATVDTLSGRVEAEVSSLLAFCSIADRRGLPIPNYQSVRETLVLWHAGIVRDVPVALLDWPPPEVVPALALAQHHGLPTCLLDFTWDPYVAAYFAVRALCMRGNGTGELAVWIVHDMNLAASLQNRDRHPARLLVPPASDNRTLQAQEGLFMYVPISEDAARTKAAKYTPGPTFESALLSRGQDGGVWVTQIVLAHEAALPLMHKLVKLGYESARLFPTYEGAAKSVLDYDASRIGAPSW